ncbi:MAG: hypothetical protein WB698_15760 [Solirubrobacteraceae bacterium]
MQDTTKVETVEVTVSFPLSKRHDYHHKAHEQETIGKLRAAAMEHFHVQEEPGSEYYLTNDNSAPCAENQATMLIPPHPERAFWR